MLRCCSFERQLATVAGCPASQLMSTVRQPCHPRPPERAGGCRSTAENAGAVLLKRWQCARLHPAHRCATAAPRRRYWDPPDASYRTVPAPGMTEPSTTRRGMAPAGDRRAQVFDESAVRRLQADAAAYFGSLAGSGLPSPRVPRARPLTQPARRRQPLPVPYSPRTTPRSRRSRRRPLRFSSWVGANGLDDRRGKRVQPLLGTVPLTQGTGDVIRRGAQSSLTPDRRRGNRRVRQRCFDSTVSGRPRSMASAPGLVHVQHPACAASCSAAQARISGSESR